MEGLHERINGCQGIVIFLGALKIVDVPGTLTVHKQTYFKALPTETVTSSVKKSYLFSGLFSPFVC